MKDSCARFKTVITVVLFLKVIPEAVFRTILWIFLFHSLTNSTQTITLMDASRASISSLFRAMAMRSMPSNMLPVLAKMSLVRWISTTSELDLHVITKVKSMARSCSRFKVSILMVWSWSGWKVELLANRQRAFWKWLSTCSTMRSKSMRHSYKKVKKNIWKKKAMITRTK